MRTIGRWLARAVAAVAGAVAALALLLCMKTAGLPYDSEGRYFDPTAEVVHEDVEPVFFGIVGCLALLLCAGAGVVSGKLRGSRSQGRS